MATETVLTDLKIRKFNSVEQMGQHESDIGDDDLVFTDDTSIRLPILTPMFFDHQANDESWLSADTFSWQSGDKYVAVYEHLVADYEAVLDDTYTEFFLYSGLAYYRTPAKDGTGDSAYPGAWSTRDGGKTLYNVNTSNRLSPGASLWGTDGFLHSIGEVYYGGAQIDTIGDITIAYYLARDGHKICFPSQESSLADLYEATGVAWYYILEKGNGNNRFKLPRTKWGFTGLRYKVGEYVAPGLPDHKHVVTMKKTSKSGNDTGTVWSYYEDMQGTGTVTTTNASASNVVYGASDTVQPPATQMYLYFYVGAFSQTAAEQTAGLNAELFNGKADRNLLNTTDNVDIVIESQLPTADNGYTWYRLYKSGWVEQGGLSTGTGTRNITLPIEMASSNYNVSAMAYRANADAITAAGYGTRTTTKFSMQVSTVNQGSYTWNSAANVLWQVCGIAA